MKKSLYALLVIDMQKAFFNDELLAANKNVLVRRCNELIKLFKGRPAFIIRTVHSLDQSSWTLNMLEDGQGFLLAGHSDTRPIRGLRTTGLPEVIKTRDSAFFQTDLAERLAQLGIEALVLSGISSHACIAQTAADAYAANFNVVLARDAIGTNVPSLHDPVLCLLHKQYRQPLLSNKEIGELLS